MPFDCDDTSLARLNIITVRDCIRELPAKQFNMGCVIDEEECGTVACIAGWASMVLGCDAERETHLQAAARHFGLDYDYARRNLFIPNGSVSRAYSATPAQAVLVLDHLLNTGDADWRVAFKGA